MKTSTAIALLEELGSSDDPIELYGKTQEIFSLHKISKDDSRTPSQLDVGLVSDASKMQVRYYSCTKSDWCSGTLSGMVNDRLKDQRVLTRGMKVCCHCGGVL